MGINICAQATTSNAFVISMQQFAGNFYKNQLAAMNFMNTQELKNRRESEREVGNGGKELKGKENKERETNYPEKKIAIPEEDDSNLEEEVVNDDDDNGSKPKKADDDEEEEEEEEGERDKRKRKAKTDIDNDDWDQPLSQYFFSKRGASGVESCGVGTAGA